MKSQREGGREREKTESVSEGKYVEVLFVALFGFSCFV